MAKANLANIICDAITDIKNILASSTVKSPLLMERLKREEQQLQNELYEEIRKKRSPFKRQKAGSPNTPIPKKINQGGQDDN